MSQPTKQMAAGCVVVTHDDAVYFANEGLRNIGPAVLSSDDVEDLRSAMQSAFDRILMRSVSTKVIAA